MADYDKSPQTNRLSCYTGSQLSVRLIFAFHYSFPDVRAPFSSQHTPRAACHNFNNTSLSQFSSLTTDAGTKWRLKEECLTSLASCTAKEDPTALVFFTSPATRRPTEVRSPVFKFRTLASRLEEPARLHFLLLPLIAEGGAGQREKSPVQISFQWPRGGGAIW